MTLLHYDGFHFRLRMLFPRDPEKVHSCNFNISQRSAKRLLASSIRSKDKLKSAGRNKVLRHFLRLIDD